MEGVHYKARPLFSREMQMAAEDLVRTLLAARATAASITPARTVTAGAQPTQSSQNATPAQIASVAQKLGQLFDVCSRSQLFQTICIVFTRFRYH